MALSVNDFGKAVVAAGLVSADDLKALVASLSADARPRQVAALANLLVERDLLTRYQADELLADRGKALVLGDYIVQDKIGAGGMGQVLKAVHRKMGRTIALKLMSAAAMKDEAAIKRFHREVKAAARLEHENIVTAHAAGEAHGMHYLVMQYVEGNDLSGRVKKEGPLSVDLAMDCICHAARGLAYAHSEGVIHRDIKPANLLLDKKGVVKILDMGLARIDDGDTHDGLTGTEQVLGTVDYMSPEQSESTRNCDARADIYSLGCTLWYLLTGTKVYPGETAVQRIMAHRDAPLPSLLKARDDIPWALEKLFHRMVAKQQVDRIQTMDEVVQEIEQIRGVPETSRTSALDEDTNLGQFFKTIGGTGATRPSALAKPAAGKSSEDDGDTLGQSDSWKTLRSTARQVPPWKNPKALAGAGVAAILLVLLGVWVIMRDKEGKPVAKVNVPDGGSVEAQPKQVDKNKTATKSVPTTASVASPLSQPTSIKGGGTKAYNSPTFQQWMKSVQALPAQQQVDAVSKKMMELNPGFDGQVTDTDGKGVPNIESGTVTGIGFFTDSVIDISPVRALAGLRGLWCYSGSPGNSRLSDLSPLQGMPLEFLSLLNVPVSDLSSLEGMPLRKLYFHGTRVSDLSPLRGMKLTNLGFDGTPVSDLSPLQGMPLNYLACKGTQVSNLLPLEDCKSMGLLSVVGTKVTAAGVAALQKTLPNCKIEWGEPKPESGKPWTYPLVAEWVFYRGGLVWVENKPISRRQDLPATNLVIQRVAFRPECGISDADLAVLVEWPKSIGFSFSRTELTDAGLRQLAKHGCGNNLGLIANSITGEGFDAFKDVSLATLVLQHNNFTPAGWQAVAEVGRVGMLSLYSSNVNDEAFIEFARHHPQLRSVGLESTNLTVRSFEALRGHQELSTLNLDRMAALDDAVLEPLKSFKALTTLTLRGTRVTPTAIADLQKALPNCKIEWDDPSKPKTPEPAAGIDPDRRAAEWVLSKRGVVTILANRTASSITESNKLPSTRFVITKINLAEKKLANGELGILNGLTAITEFICSKTDLDVSDDLTDAGLVNLEGLTTLTWVDLGGRNVADAGLGHLQGLKNLKTLKMPNTNVDDAGLNKLRGLKELSILVLANTKITEKSIDTLLTFPKLSNVNVAYLDISDSAISRLSALSLSTLALGGNSKTTDATIEKLRGMTKLRTLFLTSSPKVTDQSLKTISEFSQLETLDVRLCNVNDAGLKHLESMANLKFLALAQTKVTAAGVAALQKALPNCRIEWDNPAKPKTPEPAAAGTK